MQFGPAQCVPFISHPEMRWATFGNFVRCRWWCSKRMQWRTRFEPDEFAPHMSAMERQELVSVAADELKRFRDEHYNLENNMP